QNRGPARPRETYRLSLLLGGNNASMITTASSFLGTVITRPIRSHVFWALFIDFFSGFPDLLRDAQPGTEKNELSSAQGFRNGCFIPHIFDKNNTALFLWPMISVLGHRSEGTDTGLGPFRRGWAREQAKANSHGCGVVRNVCCDVSALSGAVFKSSAAPLPTPKLAGGISRRRSSSAASWLRWYAPPGVVASVSSLTSFFSASRSPCSRSISSCAAAGCALFDAVAAKVLRWAEMMGA